MSKYKIGLSAIFLGLVLFFQATAFAAAGQLTIDLNQSKRMDMLPIKRVAIANPEIADVTVVSAKQLLIISKKEGSTSLQVWHENGMIEEFIINVTSRDTATANTIRDIIGYSNVNVEKAGKSILLEGTVANQYEKNRAEQIAALYSEKVINMLDMTDPQQIRIEAKIVEISTDKTDKLGIQYANVSDLDIEKGIVTMGTAGSFGFGQTFKNSKTGGPFADINATLQMLITNGDAKLLSQPHMVTMSGEKANILIGGEIPIPTSNDTGQINVKWREYGIKLEIEPKIGENDQISSKVKAEISSLDSTSAAAINLTSGLSIPALRSRKAESVVMLPSGSTMAIGGLINSEDGKQINKFPFLGDLPIIGHFFRSTTTTHERKEIVILITPTLVDNDEKPQMSNTMRKYMNDEAKRIADDRSANDENK